MRPRLRKILTTCIFISGLFFRVGGPSISEPCPAEASCLSRQGLLQGKGAASGSAEFQPLFILGLDFFFFSPLKWIQSLFSCLPGVSLAPASFGP